MTQESSPRRRRVAWLLNHRRLMSFEVPLLRSFGLEVYTPAKLPRGSDAASCHVEDGAPTTLPHETRARLDAQNFYDDPLADAVVEDLNRHFDAVITAAYPETVLRLGKHYQGRLFVRVFGRESPHSYTGLFSSGSPSILEVLASRTDSVWLAAAYDTIPVIEDPFLQSRTVILPLGLPDSLWAARDRWYGGDRRLFFVCPRITTSPSYYGEVYRSFKATFGDMPHLIAGDQPIPVDDPHVTGFLPADQFEDCFLGMSAMYYHSREPRHLHYHPLEGILYGTPLIFMRGGLLERLGGDEQPGACSTPSEARDKVQRLLSGDRRFARSIQASQVRILETFSWDHCRRAWEERFLPLIS